MTRASSRRLLWSALFLAACSPDPNPPLPAADQGAAPAAASAVVTTNVYPAPERLIAFGDVHGDLSAAKRALKLGGAIDDAGAWIGGSLFVVQVGDQLDRGDDDRKIMDYFEALTIEAKAKGGTFIAVNGNHELMNSAFDFRYVTEGAMTAFADVPVPNQPEIQALPEAHRPRAAAFAPGGPYAKKLAKQPLYAIVGDSVFVHGGISKKHLSYGLDKMDAETRAWLEGQGKGPPKVVMSDDGPIWLRAYSAQTGPKECKELGEVLDALGKKRMVMGHTPQKPDISFACDNRAVRVDVGLAAYYQGRIEVLEIVGDSVKVLKE